MFHLEPFQRATHTAAARSDDFVRHIMVDFDTYTGNVEWTEGAITSADITRDDIAEWVSSEGDPWMSEARNFAPGAYLLKQDNNGLVWAMHYADTASRDADFADFETAYAEWADDSEGEV